MKKRLVTRIKDLSAFPKILGRTLLSTDHPLLATVIVTRRCNLSCTYCNEFDKVSAPVPLEVMRRRIEALAKLGTAVITLSGGEPLLNPKLPEIIQTVREHGIQVTLITNGYLLSKKWIHQLNEAGLQVMQISIDNIEPDEVSMKSLTVLERKLALLKEHAEFEVNINAVLGLSDERAADAREVAKRAVHYGFSHSVAVLHDDDGRLVPLSDTQYGVYKEIMSMARSPVQYGNYYLFQKNLINGKPNGWKCRAGGRYLYICEDGLVHWCSQQRGYPGIPVEDYTVEDIRREFNTEKGCAPNCTLPCVHQSSFLDGWRGKQTIPDPIMGGGDLIPLGNIMGGQD